MAKRKKDTGTNNDLQNTTQKTKDVMRAIYLRQAVFGPYVNC